MRKPVFGSALGLALLTGTPAAQIETTFVAETDLVAWAYWHLGSQRQTVPAGTDLRAGVSLFATFYLSVARLGVSLSTSPDSILASILESGSAAGVNSFGKCGEHSTLLTFSAPRRTDAILVISTGSSGTIDQAGGAWDHTASVDIGADGSVEFNAPRGSPGRLEVPVRIGPRGLRVRTTTHSDAGAGHSGGAASFNTSMHVELKPVLGSTITTFAPACRGPALAVTRTFEGITLDAPAAPHAVGKVIIGHNRSTLPLPFSDCALATDVALVLPVQATAAGVVRQDLAIPAIVGLTLNVQMVLATDTGELRLVTSAAFEIVRQ